MPCPIQILVRPRALRPLGQPLFKNVLPAAASISTTKSAYVCVLCRERDETEPGAFDLAPNCFMENEIFEASFIPFSGSKFIAFKIDPNRATKEERSTRQLYKYKCTLPSITYKGERRNQIII
jgi:hypothetical protein